MLKKTVYLLVVVLIAISFNMSGQAPVKKRFALPDSLLIKLEPNQTSWGMAVGGIAGVNVSFWMFARYILQTDYSIINWETMSRNLQSRFVWDNDNFSTNLFGHPYQGGLYFASARTGGFKYWEALPFAVAGSLFWEYLRENEPPSLNDVFSTPIGGAAFGEVMYRGSSLVLRGNTTGVSRVATEALGFLVNPPRGVQRLLNGDAWKIKSKYVDRNAFIPFSAQLGLGYRNTSNPTNNGNSGHIGIADFRMDYNDPHEVEGNVPYEYFNMRAVLNLYGSSEMVSSLHINGLLYGWEIDLPKKHSLMTGVFQNYNYVDNFNFTDHPQDSSFRVSSAVAFGWGNHYQFLFDRDRCRFNLETYLTAVVLGAHSTDYYRYGSRDYNFGSGYAFQAHGKLTFRNRLYLDYRVHGTKLYTFKGVEEIASEGVDQLHLNAQGNQGTGFIFSQEASVGVQISDVMLIGFDFVRHYRRSNYKYHLAHSNQMQEVMCRLAYCF